MMGAASYVKDTLVEGTDQIDNALQGSRALQTANVRGSIALGVGGQTTTGTESSTLASGWSWVSAIGASLGTTENGELMAETSNPDVDVVSEARWRLQERRARKRNSAST